jgi:UDP-N-acetylmuramyl pentapeptide synthase
LVEAARGAGFTGRAMSAEAFSEPFATDVAGTILAGIPSGSAILLKGSRGARMERFLDPLRAALASA